MLDRVVGIDLDTGADVRRLKAAIGIRDHEARPDGDHGW